MVQVAENLVIPDGELTFVADRSSGPGGQNVNKVNTRVTLLFDVEGSTVLSAQQRMLLRQRLSGRIGKTGILRVVSQRHRTQLANREAATRRFVDLVGGALEQMPERVPVAIHEQANERRLEDKRRRGRVKRERSAGFEVSE